MRSLQGPRPTSREAVDADFGQSAKRFKQKI